MLTRNPQPWHGVVYIAATALSPLLILVMPQVLIDKWPGLVFMSVGGTMTAGITSYIYSGAIFTSNQIRDNKRTIRMFDQPTEEEKNMERKFIRDEVAKVVVTGGNVKTAVDKAPETVRKAPSGFVAMQNTAEVVTLAKVDNAVRMVCRLNWMMIENGNPDGDFREVTWVSTKKMTRRMLLLVTGILAGHGGIERRGSAKNSPWVVCDPDVIKCGARGPLPHPIGCWCGCQAEK